MSDEVPQRERPDKIDQEGRIRPPIVVDFARDEGEPDPRRASQQSTDEHGEKGLQGGEHTRQRTRVER